MTSIAITPTCEQENLPVSCIITDALRRKAYEGGFTKLDGTQRKKDRSVLRHTSLVIVPIGKSWISIEHAMMMLDHVQSYAASLLRTIPVRLLFTRNKESHDTALHQTVQDQLTSNFGCFCTELNNTQISADLIADEIISTLKLCEQTNHRLQRQPEILGTTQLIWDRKP